MTSTSSEMLAVVERVRHRLHPDLSRSFVEAVLTAEERNIDEPEAALREIRLAVQSELQASGAEGGT